MTQDTLANEKILCVFPDTWNGLRRGRHQIVSRLLMSNEVLVIEDPTMSILSLFREWRRIRRLWSWLSVRRPEKNLRLYTPILALPFLFKSEFIRRIGGILLRLNIWVMLKLIGFKPTLLYLSIPTVDGFVNRFGTRRTLYVAHDAWEVYPDGSQLTVCEEQTLRKVGLAIFNAKPNMERKARLNRETYYVPHGCPPVDERYASKKVDKPSDFPQRGGLVLGYWGFIDRDCVDIDLLEWLSETHPEWTIVLVGAIQKRDEVAFAGLKARSNIFFLGRKRFEERYAYMMCFDIALLCAKASDFELRACQLKVWEYVSVGLPVVGIPVEEYLGYDWFYPARTRSEWQQMIARAAREDTAEGRKKRLDFARANTWETRVGDISALVRRVLPRDAEKR
jgi:hypothetical protein